MGMPRKLVTMASIIEGVGYVGETKSMKLPNLDRKFETHRGGGMSRPVKLDMGGGDDLTLEHTYAGPIREIIGQYGLPTLSGVQMRWVGSYENDDTGEITVVEVVAQGRHQEIDRGEQKPGELGDFKVKTECVYYKETWDGRRTVLIDVLAGIEEINGVDRMAAHRAALGQF